MVDQRVVAVYFDKDRKVIRLANYGIKDGKVFDFQSGRTETGGKDLNYLRGIFRELGVGMMQLSERRRRTKAERKRPAHRAGPFVL